MHKDKEENSHHDSHYRARELAALAAYDHHHLDGEMFLTPASSALNGFLLILTCDGEVFFATHSIESYLGFHQSTCVHTQHAAVTPTLSSQVRHTCHVCPRHHPFRETMYPSTRTDGRHTFFSSNSGSSTQTREDRLRLIPSARRRGDASARCGNHGTSDPDSPCRPNLIARPRSTLLHIRLLPAFRTPRFPLNDKAAVCNHSPGADYWFHARELCTQCRNRFYAIFRRCIGALSTSIVPNSMTA
ncbi:hypothetical protein ALC62_08454 [Cyphomyrmex costatus]|uniref:PAS domain-containing protein n=1 Tax=Cyphomyrmex costatus TaxID=456900 RepID=A0A195CJ53_9HYME|nr:hypothetical protein ALC62_08454 [Cyphomyrmex costatus]